MSRSGAVLLLVAVVGLLPLSAARAESPTSEQARRAAEVRKKLAATNAFGSIDDPEVKLEDALQLLLGRNGLAYEVNEQAFKDEMVDNVLDRAIGKAIPKMTNVSLETVLRRMLARIPSSSGTTFVVRGGVVEITTRRYASPSQWGVGAGESGTVFPPETSIAFEKRPLQEALQEIADATGVNVVLDARAGDKGKTPVTATMRGVGVDTAVQLLANMADLTILPVENVLYVTTRENAKVLRAEILKLEPAKGEATQVLKAEPRKDR
jgi:hypothetical protein